MGCELASCRETVTLAPRDDPDYPPWPVDPPEPDPTHPQPTPYAFLVACERKPSHYPPSPADPPKPDPAGADFLTNGFALSPASMNGQDHDDDGGYE